MLGFEEGWDERGQGLVKETNRARTQLGSRPETLEPNEIWTLEDVQMIGGNYAYGKDDKILEIMLGRNHGASSCMLVK